ncbi:hypothetical protein Y032_0374g200 [Ancylostoma ceylanicum]|uniref:Tyrosine-protein phosphatase domain-containing protein n=1 Tax=Ancylostoma ceylanicum TaxID=53326 RepID=A0A016RTX0_9BILA|nr:hypothetical protein Y032_0374g200 [Ancylostoma ceylanicum]
MSKPNFGPNPVTSSSLCSVPSYFDPEVTIRQSPDFTSNRGDRHYNRLSPRSPAVDNVNEETPDVRGMITDVNKKKTVRRRKKAFLQETVEQNSGEDENAKPPTAQSGGKSPTQVKKGTDSIARRKREPPAAIVGVLDKFFDYVSELGVAGIKKLYNESLAVYRAPDHLYKFTEFEKNKDKNRFLDVVCLDHSRVVLTFEVPPCPNYIHANWVRFDKHDRVFIATQAPLENTIEDFWRMIFQEQCCAIINLTNHVRNMFRTASQVSNDHQCEESLRLVPSIAGKTDIPCVEDEHLTVDTSTA